MKFSKSWILTMSCMLLVNSFLLIATAYATNTTNNKNISIDPSNAKQNIEEIILSDGSTKKLCSIVVFDKSGSMANNNQNPDKRDKAVSGAILYSTIILKQDPNAKIGLVLFSNNATERVVLGRNEFTVSDFGRPGGNTNYTSAIQKARDMLTGHNNECEIKNIIFMTDGEPTDPEKSSYESQVTQAKNEGIILYSIGYDIPSNKGKKILGGLSAGGFYDTDVIEINTIFEKLANKDNRETSIKKENNKFKIKTYNIIFTKSGTIENVIDKSRFSNILGGIKNNISANSFACTIIDGNTNIIHTNSNSTILGGEGNIIENSEEASIIGGFNNKILYGKSSTIGGGKENEITNSSYSTIIGNNSKINNGDNSVAMGSGTIISGGNNSFYWNDGSSNKELRKNNVFAVISKNGVAFNTNSPDEHAQLTISGNLIVKPNQSNDQNIQCGNGNGIGILKTIKKSSSTTTCFCSCNGNKRISLYNGECEGVCNNEIKPICGDSVTFDNSTKSYNGSCNTGKAINTSYFITSNNIIHRTCQGHDGSLTSCTGTLSS